MLLRASLTNYDKNSTWNAEPINPPCGPTGEHIAQFAKSIVFSSIKGQYDKKIFKDLDSSFIWDRQPTRTASVQSTCFSPRKFGTLWENVPSTFAELSSNDESIIPVQDFFVIELNDCVIPRQITIDQVINPGAVINIWLYNITTFRWHLVWSKPPTCDTKKSRILCISLRDKISFGTKFFRVDMNQSKLKNHTQIGLIEVFGEKYTLGCSLKSINKRLELKKHHILTLLSTEYEKHNMKAILTEETDGLEVALKLANADRYLYEDLGPKESIRDSINLFDLPYELQLKIFSYLDLKTLFDLSSVSKIVYNLVTDPIIYREVNLKIYWSILNDEFLLKISKRATKIRKLDISWCGWHNSITPSVFMFFIRKCCQKVTHLRINSCAFFTLDCFHVVANVCSELREFSLHGYGKIFSQEKNILFSAVKHLQKIDFYRTQIHDNVLERIFVGSGNALRHLGLSGGFNYDLDRISRQIAKYNREIVSLDFFQSRYLSHIGLLALSHCHKLQEIDFSWSVSYMNHDKCLTKAYFREVWDAFFSNNRQLRKVFLAGTPKFDEYNVESMMRYCPNMEQIDLKHIRGFSSELFPKLRAYFVNLQYFSISIRDPTLTVPANEEPNDNISRHNKLPSNYITVARHFKPKTS